MQKHTARLQLVLPPAQREALEALAAANDSTLSYEIRKAIKLHIERQVTDAQVSQA